jgi:hypothetical protein
LTVGLELPRPLTRSRARLRAYTPITLRKYSIRCRPRGSCGLTADRRGTMSAWSTS